mmetsp:Transcript_93101/g.221435  ORF Transcript_93101/g.221435 Transcript_93101/m.221435 type:complete len:304 (+) Transcript_93101:282-1193(+)
MGIGDLAVMGILVLVQSQVLERPEGGLELREGVDGSLEGVVLVDKNGNTLPQSFQGGIPHLHSRQAVLVTNLGDEAALTQPPERLVDAAIVHQHRLEFLRRQLAHAPWRDLLGGDEAMRVAGHEACFWLAEIREAGGLLVLAQVLQGLMPAKVATIHRGAGLANLKLPTVHTARASNVSLDSHVGGDIVEKLAQGRAARPVLVHEEKRPAHGNLGVDCWRRVAQDLLDHFLHEVLCIGLIGLVVQDGVAQLHGALAVLRQNCQRQGHHDAAHESLQRSHLCSQRPSGRLLPRGPTVRISISEA